jgi:hypothetical protein
MACHGLLKRRSLRGKRDHPWVPLFQLESFKYFDKVVGAI